jgi:hypothetical protein
LGQLPDHLLVRQPADPAQVDGAVGDLGGEVRLPARNASKHCAELEMISKEELQSSPSRASRGMNNPPEESQASFEK